MNKIIAKVQCAGCATTVESAIEVVSRENGGRFWFELEATSLPETWQGKRVYLDARGFEYAYEYYCEMCSADNNYLP